MQLLARSSLLMRPRNHYVEVAANRVQPTPHPSQLTYQPIMCAFQSNGFQVFLELQIILCFKWRHLLSRPESGPIEGMALLWATNLWCGFGCQLNRPLNACVWHENLGNKNLSPRPSLTIYWRSSGEKWATGGGSVTSTLDQSITSV